MKKDKILNEEPAWKRRRKTQQAEQRRTKLWTAVVIAIVAIVLSAMVFGMARVMRHSGDVEKKAKPFYSIAKVQSKEIVGRDCVVTFHLYGQDVKKTLSRKDYDALVHGEEVKVGYKGHPETEKIKIVSWEAIKLAR